MAQYPYRELRPEQILQTRLRRAWNRRINGVPDTFQISWWTAADAGTIGDVDIAILKLPSDNGASITNVEYRVDDGAWVSSGGIVGFTISGLTNGISVAIDIRAVNSYGDGVASDVKDVTPT